MAAAKSDISISHEAWGIAETVCSFRDKIGDAWYDDEVFPAIFRPRCDAGKSRFVIVTGRFELVCVVHYKGLLATVGSTFESETIPVE
jgi:hypothetical protein